MYIVTVNFVVAAKHRETFAAAMNQQARNSLDLEADCHVFDVCVDTDNECSFFLYEKYSDAAAFDVHLESKNLLEFNELVTPWVETKTVRTWTEQAS